MSAATGMWEALRKVEERFAELTEHARASSEIVSDPKKLRDLSRERARLEETIRTLAEYRSVERTLADDERAVASGDEELAELARAELPELRARLERLEGVLKRLLLPRDPDDDKNVIVEIRAGTGGDEASLFAGDLSRMYTKYAERQGWKQEVMASSPSGVGGFKEIIFSLEGDAVYRAHEVRERGPPRAARARRPRRRAASTPRPPRWRCCPRSRRWTSTSRRRTSAWTSTAPAAPAGRA